MNNYTNVLKQIGHNFRVERTKQRLYQEKFAELADVHTNCIGKLERGKHNLTVKTIVELANSLEVPIENILTFSE